MAELLQRAISNLIENAILHGPLHGQIQVSVEPVINHHKNMLRLSVLSLDVFIDQQHLKHLFERFYQCHPSRHQQGLSGGLGLSIVASIMQLHEGSYDVQNTAQGLCFSIYLSLSSKF